MALDQDYFDAIHIDVVKKKYYNANKVEAVLADIRRQALELESENQALRLQVGVLNDRKNEIGDALLSAKTIAQQIILEARQQAADIVARAEERAREQEAEDKARRQEDLRQVAASYARLREQLQGCLDSVNADWQDYLCRLGEQEDVPAAPEDLSEKVDAIARALFSETED